MTVVLAAALLLFAQQPVNDPEETDSTFSDRQPVRLSPLPMDRAITAFRDICMAGFPDPAAFDRAAAAADLGFVRGVHEERIQEWSSQHGQITLRRARNAQREARRDRREGRGRRERWIERCDYWVAIEERVEPEVLIAAIGAALAPQSQPVEEILGYSWDLESPASGTPLKLAVLPSVDDPRIITLSLQRLAQPAP
jgi:hypothetical protein